MAWFSRFTRFGDMHFVFGQERRVSCSVACAIMAALKINKLKPGVKSKFDENGVMKIATSLFGPNPLQGVGLNSWQIVQLLNHPDLNMTGWHYANFLPMSVPQELINRVGVSGFGPVINVKPMIVVIDWSKGGRHGVVVDTIRIFNGELYATVCDPWDANVHIVKFEKNSTFRYVARRENSFDFSGASGNYNHRPNGECFVGDVFWRS